MSRFIDVLTAAATTRSIDSYESTLELSVTSSQRGECVQPSLELREKVIAALKSVGLAESDIQEGGGQVSQQYWSSSKSMSHSMVIRNADMALLVKGMAAVERIFVQYRSSLFSRFKYNFSFQSPKPIYAPSISAGEVIANVMERARKTAEAIAAAHGEEIDSLVNVYEISVASQRNLPGHDEMERDSDLSMDFSEFDKLCDAAYAPLGKSTGRGTRRFRVRFSLKNSNS